VQKLECRW